MKANIWILFLLGMGCSHQSMGQYFGFDGGVVYKHYNSRNGDDYLAFSGPDIGFSKRITPHLEARVGFQLLYYQSYPIRGKEGNTWFTARDFPGADALLAWQSEVRLSWRPSGFEKGFFTGMGVGKFADKYYLAYDRRGNAYLGNSGDLGKAFVLTGHAGYDLKIGKGNSIRFQSEVLYEMKNDYWIGSFGLGWRWAGKVRIPQPKGKGRG